MPDTISAEPWLLWDDTLEQGLTFDAPGDIIWVRNYRGRNTQPLCGNNTVTVRGLGKRNIKLQVQLNSTAARNVRKEKLIELAEANRNYKLTPPGGEEILVKFDPAVALEERWQNGMRLMTVGFQEVPLGVASGAPPPALPPLMVWGTPASFVFAAETTGLYATISWAGLVNFALENGIWITNLAHDTYYGTGLIIPKSVAGSIVYLIGTATPPAGTYQWVLQANVPDPPPYPPVYSASFTVTRP